VDDRQDAPRAATAAPEHAAPPPWRPLSALAVTAFVVAVFGGFLAFLGMWWLAVPGLLLGAVAWSTLADGRKRGRGLALAGAVLSLGAGVGAFVVHRLASEGFETALEPFVEALVRDDAAALSRWIPEALPREEIVARWRARMSAARESAGAYAGRLEVGDVWWGSLVTMIAPPRSIEREFGPPEPERIAPGSALWVRVHFEREPLWLALLPPPGSRGTEGLQDLVKSLGGNGLPRVGDVRVFGTRR
jgi:hypothetical protein